MDLPAAFGGASLMDGTLALIASPLPSLLPSPSCFPSLPFPFPSLVLEQGAGFGRGGACPSFAACAGRKNTSQLSPGFVLAHSLSFLFRLFLKLSAQWAWWGRNPTTKHKHMNTRSIQSTARIFEDVGGFYICCDSLPYLDARGCAYPSRRAAISSLRSKLAFGLDSFTHYLSKGRKVKL